MVKSLKGKNRKSSANEQFRQKKGIPQRDTPNKMEFIFELPTNHGKKLCDSALKNAENKLNVERVSCEMGIFDYRKKSGPDLTITTLTTLEGPIQIHRCNSEATSKGNEGRPICRICQGSSSSVNQLISPCNCRGTLAYVHFACLERWLNSSSRISCELCHYQYDTQQTRRYTLWESLRLWLKHPVNWRHLQADLFILTLLSIVTVVLILMCVLSLEFFIKEGKKYGVSRVWTKGALNVFLAIVILGYAGSMVFLIREQLAPWYYWWTNTHNIQLRIDCNLACIESRKKLFEELTLAQYDSAENLARENRPVVTNADAAGKGSMEGNEQHTDLTIVTENPENSVGL